MVMFYWVDLEEIWRRYSGTALYLKLGYMELVMIVETHAALLRMPSEARFRPYTNVIIVHH